MACDNPQYVYPVHDCVMWSCALCPLVGPPDFTLVVDADTTPNTSSHAESDDLDLELSDIRRQIKALSADSEDEEFTQNAHTGGLVNTNTKMEKKTFGLLIINKTNSLLHPLPGDTELQTEFYV